MIDLTASAFATLNAGGPTAPLLVTAAGVATGLGPCAGVRGAMLVALVSGAERSRHVIVGAFTAGTVLAYAFLALAVPLFSRLLSSSNVIYDAVAIGLVGSGLRTLCTVGDSCSHRGISGQKGVGGAFVAGVASAAILSPCCAPLILGILASGAQSGRPQVAAALLACFAFGHGVPTIVGTFAVAAPLGRFARWAGRDSVATVSATLCIGIGAFYAVLA